jgi:excisionase family DNA binding protein
MAIETNKEARVPLNTPGRRLFDIESAVAYLRDLGADGVTVNFVRRLINNGELPHLRIGRKFYCSREGLDRWIVNHERRK